MEGHLKDHSDSAHSACPSTGTILWWRLSVLHYKVFNLESDQHRDDGDFYWLTNVTPQAVFESFIYELELSNLHKCRKLSATKTD